MPESANISHLFRAEYGKIVSVLIRTLGIEHIETTEDIASETFLAAMETWSYKGIPNQPTSWLYQVAKTIDWSKAENALLKALEFAKTNTEKRSIKNRIESLLYG